MQDGLGRTIDYLRISVTDRCNLRCRYCMPEDIKSVPMREILTFEEITAIVACAAELGIRHVKLTGGEPLVRKGMPQLVHMLKSLPGIEQVTMTTNGVLLREQLPKLLEAGLDAVNISLDTRNPEIYRQITGRDACGEVLEAITRACDSGLRTKVNAVSLNLGMDNIRQLISLAHQLPVDVRFIEMMPIGYGRDFAVLDHRKLLQQLYEEYPDMKTDESFHGFGPAVYYRIPEYQGSVGLISAIHGRFCSSCNRVRLTSQGYLKACLCYHDGADLRRILRDDYLQKEAKECQLLAAMEQAIMYKPAAHCFDIPEQMTEDAGMNAIGG